MDRQEYLRKPFLLPADVIMFPAAELAGRVREGLDCADDDFAITRPGMRSYSRIIDRETAALLVEFRQPSPLVDAILRYSKKKELDPHEVLESAFPVLVSFAEAAFLVPADSSLAEGISASFGIGQLVAGFEVRRIIQILEDTELYQAQTAGGKTVALKITRSDPSLMTILAQGREASILEHLNGICSPLLVEYGSFRERPFIASSWQSGVPISRRAQELRSTAISTWRQQLYDLCCNLIDAYSNLHRYGVIHGDIHPHNVLVDANDSVSILDYGLSRLVGKAEVDHSYRAVLAWFMEPEMAETIIRGEESPPASFAGEQYAVAALVYFLICGEHYLTTGTEKDALYQEILEGSPPPFTRHGFESWPEIEAVLLHALAKAPQHRFKSMTEFSMAFRQAHLPKSNKQIVYPKRQLSSRKWIDAILKNTAIDPLPYDKLFPQPPTASLYFGSAGLVWFLYRAAIVREDAHLLASADLWSQRIMNRIENPQSFESPDQILTEEQIASTSLYLGQCGVYYVNALASHSRGDLSSVTRQVRAFLNTAKAGDGMDDLLYGHSGILLGGSMLLDILRWSPRLDAEPLADYLREEAGRQWSTLQGLPAVGEKHGLSNLGVAHGWAGIIYSQLLVYKALRLPPPITLQDRLQQLANQAEPAARGISWLGTVHHPGQNPDALSHAPGWCSGTAGHLYLWILANESFREDRYLALAEKAAWHTWEHLDRFPNLCCGLTGRAFALLRYYRYTGESVWLDRAKQLAGAAIHEFGNEFAWNGRTLSLYRGPLGAAMLAVELDQPERAIMPVFEPESWP